MKSFYRRFTSFVLSVVVLGMALASNAVPAQAATAVQVDDDHAQCPHAAFTNLQTAINAVGSNPGKITVCAGTYHGPFLVSGANNLKLIGRKGAVIAPSSLPFNGSLFDVISSTNVTVQGFTFDGMGNVGSSTGNAALQYSASSGKIVKNTVQNWHTLNYATPANQIYSIYLTSDNNQALTLTGNRIVEFQGRGMMIEGPSVIKVTGNKLFAGTNTNNAAIGIYLLPIGFGFPRGSIRANQLVGGYTNFGTAITSGIWVIASSNLTVAGNKISRQVNGIMFNTSCSYSTPVNNNVVRGNKLDTVLAGISFQVGPAGCNTQADGNKVTGNKVINKFFKGTSGIEFAADCTTGSCTAQNEVVKGNRIDNFNFDLFLFENGNGVVSGVFTPNKLLHDGP